MKLTEQDFALVKAAVTKAETGTDGEIATIVSAQSDAYHDVGLIWAVLVMLLALATIAAFPHVFVGLLDRVSGGWHHDWSLRELLTILLAVLTAKFLAMRYLLVWNPLRMALTPRKTKARRVRRRAILLFRAGTEKRTLTRTGVLLYLSLAEHQAEIVADEAIAAKVAPEVWGEAMAVMIDHLKAGRPGEGMAAAVERIGAVLAEHCPHSGSDPDEMPDRLILL